MLIFKDFTFDAAHFLPKLPPAHKCAAMHGHTYHVRIYAKGTPGEQSGWIVDFGEIKESVHLILNQLDHKCLNSIPGLENPTCEVISMWIWQRLKPLFQPLASIELRETLTSGVIYDGT
jgi:6-pyruvoyltetrahydropterin/6-carboxytetrahydropterin synthase